MFGSMLFHFTPIDFPTPAQLGGGGVVSLVVFKEKKRIEVP